MFTLLVSIVNFSSQRTNVLQGFVHLVLFMTYIVLIFDWVLPGYENKLGTDHDFQSISYTLDPTRPRARKVTGSRPTRNVGFSCSPVSMARNRPFSSVASSSITLSWWSSCDADQLTTGSSGRRTGTTEPRVIEWQLLAVSSRPGREKCEIRVKVGYRLKPGVYLEMIRYSYRVLFLYQ